jgi:hypothetical protein
VQCVNDLQCVVCAVVMRPTVQEYIVYMALTMCGMRCCDDASMGPCEHADTIK